MKEQTYTTADTDAWSDELAAHIENIIETWIDTVSEPRGGYYMGSHEDGPFTAKDGAVFYRRRLYDPNRKGESPAALTVFFGGVGGMTLNIHDWRYPEEELTAIIKRLPMFEEMPLHIKQEFLRKTKPQALNIKALEKVRAAASAELKEKRAKVSEEAAGIYSGSVHDPVKIAAHAYIQEKQIRQLPPLVRWAPYGPNRQDPVLIVPVVDPFTDNIITLQRIYQNGDKRFMSSQGANPLYRGGYFPVKIASKETVILCEGFATGCSLAELSAPNDTVFSCFDCSNMERTARAILSSDKWQEVRELIIACDLDENFAGQKAAVAIEEYAQSIGQADRVLIIPPVLMQENGTDWNDKVIEAGLDEASKLFDDLKFWRDRTFSQRFKEQMKEAEAHGEPQ